ncbi:MAG: pyruvate dehydrogenase (acetyl-transferring) E1 component subunit alpha [Rickettsiales bacterium]
MSTAISDAAGVRIDAHPSCGLSKADLLRLYYDMTLIRRFEEKAGQLYGMGMIGGFCHLYIGQEAVAVGMQHVIKEGDSVITTYRDHGLMLACGSDPYSVLTELMGRRDGCSQGKGGSMHMFDLKKEFYGGHGIVGAPVPLGTGVAFAHKYKNKDNICLTYFGDGAVNQGQVYEAFNMAALWKLPVLYIIENNEYAMGMSVKRSSSTTELYLRGDAFGIAGAQVDGMDVFAVMEAGRKAVDHVRGAQEPFILEMKTYRYRGHSMSDPAKYRSREEVDHMKETRDPIDKVRAALLAAGCSENQLKSEEKKIKDMLHDVVERAKVCPEPDEGLLWTDVYSD